MDRPLEGELVYSGADMAFDYSLADDDSNSMQAAYTVAETLSLEFEMETGKLLYVWGYSPRTSWIRKKIEPPQIEDGVVKAQLGSEDYAPGVNYPLEGLDSADVLYDEASEWVRMGYPYAEQAIQIANGVIVGLTAAKIVTIWLRPKFVD